MNKKNLILIFVLTFQFFILTGCSSLFTWKDRAVSEETEEFSEDQDLSEPKIPTIDNLKKKTSSSKKYTPPLTDPAPPPQHIVGLKENNAVSKNELEYSSAFATQSRAEFLAASEMWKIFLSHYPADALASSATFNLALCEYSLGNYSSSIQTLKPLLTNTSLGLLGVDIRLLYAENLIEEGNLQEALSISFEIFPNPRLERQAGLTRVQSSFYIPESQIPLFQKIRAYLLRARAYLGLLKLDKTSQSLDIVEALLQQSSQSHDSLKPLESMRLSAFWGWRKLQYISLNCSEQNPFPLPKTLSEEGFLSYVEHYYSCIEGARRVFCTVHQNHFEAVEPLAVFTLKEMVLLPLKMKQDLKEVLQNRRNKSEKATYEAEMAALIEKQVYQHSLRFKNIDECGVENLYE